MNNTIFETSIIIHASPSKIFWFYADVNNWSQWDPEIKQSHIYGDFIEGTSWYLKPRSGPKNKFTLTQVTPEKWFIATTDLPLSKIYFERILLPDGLLTKVIHRVYFDWFLWSIFEKLLWQKLKKEQLRTMESLKKELEK